MSSSVSRPRFKITKGKLIVLVVAVLMIAGIANTIYQALSSPFLNVGSAGSAHIHADLAVYLNGKAITPFPAKYYLKSNYVHLEGGPGGGFVPHIHARNLPLGLFIGSLGMGLTKDCFTTDDGKKYCNDGTNTLKLFVKHENGNWEQNDELDKYVMQDLDMILVSYGSEGPDAIKAQQESVTSFSKDNLGRTMPLPEGK